MDTDKQTPEHLIVFLDANIVLEGKNVADLPWNEITTEGTIVVVIVPKAMDEIDAKKRDGRLGPHARAFNRLIGPAVIENLPVVLRECSPRVELKMGTCSRIDWNDYDGLDPDDGDSRIVAEALNIQNVDSSRRILVSHDIKPLAYARGRDLNVFQASDAWLRPVEPSPQDKQIQRLKQQLTDLKQDEPTFEISVAISDSGPMAIYEVTSLSPEEAALAITAIRRKNGAIKQHRDPHGLNAVIGNYDSSYDKKYIKYIDEIIPDFVKNISNKLEMIFNQRTIKITVKNIGQIRADNLVISIKSNDGWINQKLIAMSPSGPRPPYPRPYRDLLYRGPNISDLVQRRVGRHEFEISRSVKRTQEIETTCEDFRSGQEYIFSGIIVPKSQPKPMTITVSITAANLRGERIETFQFEKQLVDISPGELVDFGTLQFKRGYPIEKELDRLINLKRYDDVEFEGDTNDN